jgi:hypothetical protein
MRAIAAIVLLATCASTYADAYWVLRSYADDLHASGERIPHSDRWADLDFWNANGSFCVTDSSTGKCIGVTAAEACKFTRDRYALQASKEAKKTGKPATYSLKCRFVAVYNDR